MINISPSFIFFLSGILAATSVNIITGFTNENIRYDLSDTIIACLPWLFASLFLAVAGVHYEKFIREFQAVGSAEGLTIQEIESLRVSKYKNVKNKIRFNFFLGFSCFAAGILFPIYYFNLVQQEEKVEVSISDLQISIIKIGDEIQGIKELLKSNEKTSKIINCTTNEAEELNINGVQPFKVDDLKSKPNQ